MKEVKLLFSNQSVGFCRYFFTYLLPHSAPPALQPFLSDILNATGTS